MHRTFTPYEATQTLPLVKRIVKDILPRGQEAMRLVNGVRTVEVDDRLHELEGELEELFAELEQIGCSFRCPSFEVGLVDFPSVIEGEPVLLCWRDDEPELRFFHAPHAGFAGRRLIPPDLLNQAD